MTGFDLDSERVTEATSATAVTILSLNTARMVEMKASDAMASSPTAATAT